MRELDEYLKNQRFLEWGSLIIPIILGLYLRAQTLKWHRLFAYDPYYFYRVATHIAQGGSIFDRDPMIVTLSRRFIDDEPGLPLIWGYLSKITHVDTWTLGIYLPLVIFILEVLMIYKLAKDAFNWRVGVLSALFLAVLPGHIYRSHAGGIWKDTLGSLFMLMFLHAVILITKSEKLDRDKMIKYGAYLISSLYLSAFTFDGFGAFPGAVSLYLVLLPLIHKPRKNEFLIAGLIIIPLVFAYITLPTYTREKYALIPFLIASLISILALGVAYYLKPCSKYRRAYGGILVVIFVLLIYTTLFTPISFLKNVSKMAWMFINTSLHGKSAQSIPNSLELLFTTWFSTSLVFALLGAGYLLKDIREKISLLFITWGIMLAFLGIAMVRLTFIMSFTIVIAAALGIELIYITLSRKFNLKKLISVSAVIILIGIIPPFHAGNIYVSMAPVPPDYWLYGLEWMQDNISDSLVFNWWDWGYWLEAYGIKTIGDNGAQTGISYNLYANLMLSNYSQFQFWFNKYSKLVSTISSNNNLNKERSIDYIIIGFDIFQKSESLRDAYNKLVVKYNYPPPNLHLVILPLKYVGASHRIYTNGQISLLLRSQEALLVIDGSSVKIRDIVYEKKGSNKVLHLNPSGVIVYVNGPYSIVFNEDSLNKTIIQLFVYENQSNARLIWENSFIKVYYPLPDSQNISR